MSKRYSILLVEDEENLHETLKLNLELEGYEVTSAYDGNTALQKIQAEYFDLIILDVMLPDINGKEVCQRVRSDSALDDVRIICISGMVEADKIQDLRNAGANHFLQKPFEVETLIDNICRLLDIEQLQT